MRTPSLSLRRRALLRTAALVLATLLPACGGNDSAPAGPGGPGFDAAAYFHARQRAAQDHALAQGAGGLSAHLVRFERDAGPLDPETFRSTFEKIRERSDTADFPVSILVRMLYQYGDHPLMTAELKAEIEEVLLGFKYWMDEPGTDPMVYWSENHENMFHSSEYLVGQMFPDRPFDNDGKSGAAHRDKARALLTRWMDLRASIGFTEWHSSNYYEEDIGPLLNLVDFAEDPDIATRAAILVDLLLFDIALNSHEGVFGGSHGRTFERKVTGADEESTHSTAHLAFGQGRFTRTGSLSMSPLSVTERYVPAAAVLLAGRPETQPAVWTDHARMSIDVEDAATYGLTTDPDDFESYFFWWSAGAYALVETVDGTFNMANTFGLFEVGDFFPLIGWIRPLWEAGLVVPILEALPELRVLLEGISLMTTNSVAHHNPFAALGSAQDKLAGGPSFQNFSWSATLGPDTVVFTTHPLQEGSRDDDYFSLFSGGASHPRIAQDRDVALILYNPFIEWPEAILPTTGFTHAYFPLDLFDETEQVGNWTFGRDEQGYVGLYSHNPVRVSTEADGRYPGRRLIAQGPRNLWICEIGWSGEDGSFRDFIDRVSGQAVAFDLADDLRVTYASDQGPMTFSWTGPLRVDGVEVPIHDFPRYDNPFAHVPWGARRFEITAGGVTSILDFDIPLRATR